MDMDDKIRVRVSRVEFLTSSIALYRLEPIAGNRLPSFTAGSHIKVQITPNLVRAYSLCSDPALASSYYCIAVKREDKGRGGSQAMHQSVLVGSELLISPPQNFFPLAETASHHLLVAGGIGLTPIMAMAHSLYAKGEAFSLVVCTSFNDKLLFSQLFHDLPWQTYFFSEGRSSLALRPLLQTLPEGLHVYCCGPEGMMSAVKQQCENLPASQWHQESFTSHAAETQSESFELYLSESDQRIVVKDMTMLAALREAGVTVDSVCEQGICGHCLVRWRDGEPIHHDVCLEPGERAEYIALCCAGCQSPSLTLEL